MLTTVKKLSLGFNPNSKSNVFTSGDSISGNVTLELEKECKIDSLYVKMKGKAKVRWTESYGKTVVVYSNKEKFFSVKTFLIQQDQGCNVVGRGSHVYPFTFQIPTQPLPSSFKGSFGRIRYTLQAVLSRSMRSDSKAKVEFPLIHRESLNNQLLKVPQQSMIEKKMGLFTSGSVAMDVNLERTSFLQGKGIKVVASIQNKSSREIKVKYCLYRKCSYFAWKRRKVETNDVVKEVGEVIPPAVCHTVTRVITIPPTTGPSTFSCSILTMEYRLRVYLDVKFAVDPKIKFPIIVLAAPEPDPNEEPPAYLSFGFDATNSSNNFPPTSPAFDIPSAPLPSYNNYGMYPPITGFGTKS